MIVDFTPGQDRIGFGGDGPNAFEELTLADEDRDGASGTLIGWGENTLWLKGVVSGSLGAGDFLFA
ncbi:hypothetical protein [Phenylobacterium sp. J367]|uniref:hypothetical protein n=1 Tax=Phenylobacterium sp. J367 TaxID=2898435 RepID=UPI00215076BB|nr:hypothetical protein [Phenylobacterium sp. J367]MCR5879948.1 hypothetical protein [Phenylobacterium sp. J367]